MNSEKSRNQTSAAAMERASPDALVAHMIPAQAQLPNIDLTEQLVKCLENLVAAAVHLMSICCAEIAIVLGDLRLGLGLYGLVLLILLLQAALDREEKVSRLCLALALVPLMRILSLGTPFNQFHPLAWHLIVAGQLLLGTVIVITYLSLRPGRIGLRLEPGPFGLVLVGFPLGIAEYYLLKPTVFLSTPSLLESGIAPLVLILCTGFVEELLFRGILLHISRELVGDSAAVLYVALLSTVLQLGWLSWPHILLSFSINLFFGWVVLRTREIYSVSLAHGFTNVVFLILAPLWFAG
jgi:membrane protease YdiL (CAAX protease family)